VKRTVTIVAALAALVLASAAGAKGPDQPVVCGAGKCAPFSTGTDWGVGMSAYTGTTEPSPAPAPYFRVGWERQPLLYWVPSARLVRQVDPSGVARWMPVPVGLREALERSSAGLQPFPVPTDATVLVGHDAVHDPVSYFRVFSAGVPVLTWPRSVEWVPIRFFTTPASPWGDDADSVWISKRGSYLLRNRHVVRIAPALADRIRARRPLR
jgi:hypothetical protein